jgi:hypothetical protein
VLTYTDADGDHVTLTISKGTLAAGMFTFDTGGVTGDNSAKQQLQIIDMSAAADLDGANITMKVTKAGGGDGFAAVGRIEAGTHDLGRVAIKGDLGQIHRGKGMGTMALQSLSAGRLAVLDAAVNPGGSFDSQIGGGLGALNIVGDMDSVLVQAGAIGSITIGDSFVGGASTNTGRIIGSSIGPVKITHDLQGGGGLFTGEIESLSTLGTVTIGGSIIDGTNDDTGEIKSTGAMGAVKISGDLDGGTGMRTGRIFSGGTIASVQIGGSILGGSKLDGGAIESTGAMGAVKIGGDVKDDTGGRSGSIQSSGTMGNVTIGGSLVGGLESHRRSGRPKRSDRQRRSDGHGENRWRCAERWRTLFRGNHHGRDWTASDLVAGVQDGSPSGFGKGDTLIGFGASIAKIASIVIGGSVAGVVGSAETFAFESHAIGSFKLHGTTIAIPPHRASSSSTPSARSSSASCENSNFAHEIPSAPDRTARIPHRRLSEV